MVLVSYILDNHSSILQTKISNREGHKARRIRLEALPLDQHIEGRHGEREPRVEILPHAVRDPLEMADHGQHREHRFHQHAVLPLDRKSTRLNSSHSQISYAVFCLKKKKRP